MAALAGLAAVTNLPLARLPVVASVVRPSERRGRWAPATVLYPAFVAVLLIVFRHRSEIAVVAWVVHSAGDPAAAWAGRRWPRGRWPWNPGKTAVGSAAYLVAGALAGWLTLAWTVGVAEAAPLLLGVGIASLVAALVESLDSGVDDNLVALVAAAGALMVTMQLATAWRAGAPPLPGWTSMVPVIVGCGIAAVLAGAVTRGGASLGVLLAWGVTWGLGWRGLVVFGALVLLGAVATRIGWRSKQRRGLAAPRGGRRTAGQVLAKGLVPAICALVGSGPGGELWRLAFVGALAAAASDTVATECGQLLGRRVRLLPTLRRVPPGTPGGVSVPGTLAGVLAAATIGAVGLILGVVEGGGAVVAAAAGISASTAESVLRPWIDARARLAPRTANLVTGCLGALIAAWIGA